MLVLVLWDSPQRTSSSILCQDFWLSETGRYLICAKNAFKFVVSGVYCCLKAFLASYFSPLSLIDITSNKSLAIKKNLRKYWEKEVTRVLWDLKKQHFHIIRMTAQSSVKYWTKVSILFCIKWGRDEVSSYCFSRNKTPLL